MVCQPVGPRCDICLLGIKKLCPSRVSGVRAEGRKVVEYTYTLDDGGDLEDIVIGSVINAELADDIMEEVKTETEDLVKIEYS